MPPTQKKERSDAPRVTGHPTERSARSAAHASHLMRQPRSVAEEAGPCGAELQREEPTAHTRVVGRIPADEPQHLLRGVEHLPDLKGS